MSTVGDDYRTVATPPPPLSVVRAMLWNWWIVVVSVVVFVAIGAGIALLRTPVYTATSRLVVGRIDITAPGALSGYAVATQSLATGYSRTVSARPVAVRVAAKTGISVKDVQSHVTATPIPESPVFRVEATSPDADQAVELANASSRALIRYAAKLGQDNPDSRRLYVAYRGAIVHRRVAKRQLAIATAGAATHPSPADEEEVDSALSEVEAASLRVAALGKAYTASVQSQAATQLIQVVSPATEASSDRRSTFMIFAFVGFVVGLLVGAALAYVRELRIRVKPASS